MLHEGAELVVLDPRVGDLEPDLDLVAELVEPADLDRDVASGSGYRGRPDHAGPPPLDHPAGEPAPADRPDRPDKPRGADRD